MAFFDVTWSLQALKLLPPVLRDRDFQEKNDDFLSGDADNQVIERIILSSPGHWKEFPVIGIGIWNYLQGTQSAQVLQRNIQVQLKADIFPKPYVDVSRWPTVIINNSTFEISDGSV